jgi:hypothetical protein
MLNLAAAPSNIAGARSGIIGVMTDATQFPSRIEAGDSIAIEYHLPLVDEELKRPAAPRLNHKKLGQTLLRIFKSQTVNAHGIDVRPNSLNRYSDRG